MVPVLYLLCVQKACFTQLVFWSSGNAFVCELTLWLSSYLAIPTGCVFLSVLSWQCCQSQECHILSPDFCERLWLWTCGYKLVACRSLWTFEVKAHDLCLECSQSGSIEAEKLNTDWWPNSYCCRMCLWYHLTPPLQIVKLFGHAGSPLRDSLNIPKLVDKYPLVNCTIYTECAYLGGAGSN